MQLTKRLPRYLAGVLFMTFGITLLNASNLGSTPMTSLPFALSKMLEGRPFWSFGMLTLLFYCFSILLQVLLARRVRITMLLQLPVAMLYSVLLDIFKSWVRIPDPAFWLRCVLCVAGSAIAALGIVLIVQVDLMLPPPDALMHAISEKTGIELGRVKMAGDMFWVLLTVLASAAYLRTTGVSGLWPLLRASCDGHFAVGIGTLFTMYFTGRMVVFFRRHLKLIPFQPIGEVWHSRQEESA